MSGKQPAGPSPPSCTMLIRSPGIPAQERRHAVVPQRRHGERADLALVHRLAGRLVDHLAIEQVGPQMRAGSVEAFAGNQRAFRHAELVEHLGAPHALELLPLGQRQRLGGDDDLLHGARGEIEALGFRQVGEAQP